MEFPSLVCSVLSCWWVRENLECAAVNMSRILLHLFHLWTSSTTQRGGPLRKKKERGKKSWRVLMIYRRVPHHYTHTHTSCLWCGLHSPRESQKIWRQERIKEKILLFIRIPPSYYVARFPSISPSLVWWYLCVRYLLFVWTCLYLFPLRSIASSGHHLFLFWNLGIGQPFCYTTIINISHF